LKNYRWKNPLNILISYPHKSGQTLGSYRGQHKGGPAEQDLPYLRPIMPKTLYMMQNGIFIILTVNFQIKIPI
jgi:hypothetical protein